jgi:NitT/TauT family transport system ATP-binding protein
MVTETGAAAKAVVEARGLGLTFQTADGPVHALKDVNLRSVREIS